MLPPDVWLTILKALPPRDALRTHLSCPGIADSEDIYQVVVQSMHGPRHWPLGVSYPHLSPWRVHCSVAAVLNTPHAVRRQTLDAEEETEGVDCTLLTPTLRAYGLASGRVRVYKGYRSMLAGRGVEEGGGGSSPHPLCPSMEFIVGAGSIRHMAWARRRDGLISGLIVGSFNSAVHHLDLAGFIGGGEEGGVGGGGSGSAPAASIAVAAAPPSLVMAVPWREESKEDALAMDDVGPVWALLAVPLPCLLPRPSSPSHSDAASGGGGGGWDPPPSSKGPPPLWGGEGPRSVSALCVSSRDGAIRVTDAKGVHFELRGHTGGVTDLALCLVPGSPHLTRLVSSSYDGTVRVWDLGSMACTHILTGHKGPVWSIVADWRVGIVGGLYTVFSSGADGTVREWKFSGGGEEGGKGGKGGECHPSSHLPFSSSPTVLHEHGMFPTLVNEGGTFSHSHPQVFCLQLVGKILVGGTSNGEIHAWDATTHQPRWSFCCSSLREGGGGIKHFTAGAEGRSAPHPLSSTARRGVRRLEVMGPFLIATMKSGALEVFNLVRGDLPTLSDEWEVLVQQQQQKGGAEGEKSSTVTITRPSSPPHLEFNWTQLRKSQRSPVPLIPPHTPATFSPSHSFIIGSGPSSTLHPPSQKK
jgi:hypothetical protein